ncbi:IS5 family transposase [Kineococcus sp. SYSU DK006]|uniref:IS5 family transposase n=1 Tax=Kineococcus sp. SYSU DK006 TaxID=3383127 RepID=UPI003D7EA52A
MAIDASTRPRQLISDELWELLKPLLPAPPPAPRGRTGRPRRDDRAVLEGIVFVLSTGIGWAKSPAGGRYPHPAELGYGSGWTCLRRLRQWQQAGVWEELHGAVLDRLGQQVLLDWSRACIDSVSVRAKKGGALTGPNPTDRGKLGTKYHLLVTADGLPLNVVLSGANRHDSMLLAPLLDGQRAVKGVGRGRPRRRPVKLHADKGYDNRRCRAYLRRRGITARIARIGIESSQRLGRHRWVVERTIGWLLSYKRLALRYDSSARTITALARLAITLICARRLPTTN